MEEIIYRLEKKDIPVNINIFYYDKYEPIPKQALEFMRHRYFRRSMPTPYDDKLHIYEARLVSYRLLRLYIPLNFANKNHIYIDYLYYSRVINERNFAIFIDGRYLIDLERMKIRRDPFSIIKKDDYRYNENTHMFLYVERNFKLKWERP